MMVVIQCKECRRPFSSYAKRCPDCGWRSWFWFRSVGVRVLSVVIAAIALVGSYRMARKNLERERAEPQIKPTADQQLSSLPSER